jgi:hypothetical protein
VEEEKGNSHRLLLSFRLVGFGFGFVKKAKYTRYSQRQSACVSCVKKPEREKTRELGWVGVWFSALGPLGTFGNGVFGGGHLHYRTGDREIGNAVVDRLDVGQ